MGGDQKKALGKVSSLLNLAAGRVPEELLRAFCDPRDGLFPARGEISFSCSCPDSARLCKHLAAVFYGIGARLDEDPALFFTLRGIDPGELLSATGAVDALTAAAGDAPEIDASALGDVFGVDFDDPAAAAPPPPEVASPKSKVKSRKSQVAKESHPPGGGWREAPGGERETLGNSAKRRGESAKCRGESATPPAAWTAKRLRALRRSLGLTQKAFGERLGLSNVAVCYLETGRKPIPAALAPVLDRLS